MNDRTGQIWDVAQSLDDPGRHGANFIYLVLDPGVRENHYRRWLHRCLNLGNRQHDRLARGGRVRVGEAVRRREVRVTKNPAPGQLWMGGFGDESFLIYTLHREPGYGPDAWACLMVDGAGRYREGRLDVWTLEDVDGYFRPVR